MPVLRVISGPYAGHQFPLAEGVVELGREAGCGIFLPDDGSVSRRHARLEFQGGRLVAHDLGSSHGLFVNGSRTVSTILQPGDQILVGNSAMVLEADPVPEPAPIPAPAPIPTPAPPGFMPPGAPPYGAAPGAPAGYAAPPGPPGSPYAVYPPPAPVSATPAVPYAKWIYFLGFSIPPVGLILGLIYLLKETPEERAVGKWCLIWSAIGMVIAWLSWIVIKDALHSILSSSNGQDLKGLLGDPTSDPSSTLKQSVPPSVTNSLPGLPVR